MLISAAGASMTVCRGSDFVTLTFRSSANGDSLVRTAVGKEPGRSCAPVGLRTFSDVAVPTFELPIGVKATLGSGGGGGIDDAYSRMRLETPMTPATLAVHFTPQMTAAGWKVDGSPAGDLMMSVTRLTMPSKTGDPVTALILIRLGETPYVDAMLRVVGQKPAIR